MQGSLLLPLENLLVLLLPWSDGVKPHMMTVAAIVLLVVSRCQQLQVLGPLLLARLLLVFDSAVLSARHCCATVVKVRHGAVLSRSESCRMHSTSVKWRGLTT